MIEIPKQEPLIIIIEIIISFCVFALFSSVVLDFLLFSKSSEVRKEKKSIVETGTMTGFFIVFYFILQSGTGVIATQNNLLRKLLMIIGTAAIAAGCGANIIGRFNLGHNWANQIKIYEGHSLIKSGMYKHVRHPLYASIMLMFYGASAAYRNYFSFLAVTFVFIPFMYHRAKQEEKLLMEVFPEYGEYKKNTGMFFPKIFKRKW